MPRRPAPRFSSFSLDAQLGQMPLSLLFAFCVDPRADCPWVRFWFGRFLGGQRNRRGGQFVEEIVDVVSGGNFGHKCLV